MTGADLAPKKVLFLGTRTRAPYMWNPKTKQQTIPKTSNKHQTRSNLCYLLLRAGSIAGIPASFPARPPYLSYESATAATTREDFRGGRPPEGATAAGLAALSGKEVVARGGRATLPADGAWGGEAI